MTQNLEQTIAKLIDKQKFAYLGSLDAEGFSSVKAMLAPRKCEGIKTFYFTTNASSMRVSQYRNSPKACTYFCEEELRLGTRHYPCPVPPRSTALAAATLSIHKSI